MAAGSARSAEGDGERGEANGEAEGASEGGEELGVCIGEGKRDHAAGRGCSSLRMADTYQTHDVP